MNTNYRTDSTNSSLITGTIRGEQVCLEGGGATIIISPSLLPHSCSDGPQRHQTGCQLTSLPPPPQPTCDPVIHGSVGGGSSRLELTSPPRVAAAEAPHSHFWTEVNPLRRPRESGAVRIRATLSGASAKTLRGGVSRRPLVSVLRI